MLHALKEYAEATGLESEPGFKPKEVKWLIVFNSKGQYVNVQRLGDGKLGELFSKCPHLTQPELKGGGAGCRHFLVDGLDVITLLTAKGAPDDRQVAKHRFFLDLLDQASTSEKRLKHVHAGLRAADQLQQIRDDLAGFKPKAKPADLATFAVIRGAASAAGAVIANDDSWHDWWRNFRRSLGSGKKKKASKAESRLCFLTGETIEPASTHPKITGLASVGGMAAGDVYASFKQESFQSYGLAQSSNAALSEEAAKLYTTALNDLIRNHSVPVAGTRVAFWYVGRKDVPDECDAVKVLCGDFDFTEVENVAAEDTSAKDDAAGRLREQYQAEHAGRRLLQSIETAASRESLPATFRAVTLSANSGRVEVREWMEGSFEDLAQNVNDWFEDLSIQNLPALDETPRLAKSPKFGFVVTCPLPERKPAQKYTDWIKPVGVLRESLWRSALRGRESPIPDSVASRVLLRQRQAMMSGEVSSAISIDGDRRALRLAAWYTRMGLLKAYLIRKGNEHVTPYLNEDHPSAAYHCGRFLAVCQHIQSLAIGEPKSSVLDRFYSACSATPGLIIPTIWKTARHHLRRIKRDKSGVLQRDLTGLLIAIHSRLEDAIPRTLSLEEQSLFQLGFFQQQAYLPTPASSPKLKTKKGYLVRSKSEVLIANALHDAGVECAYETQLVVDGVEYRDILPDFTVTRTDDTPCYIEHLGLLDRPAYAHRWEIKKRLYHERGIHHVDDGGGSNGILVTTTEQEIADMPALTERLLAILKTPA